MKKWSGVRPPDGLRREHRLRGRPQRTPFFFETPHQLHPRSVSSGTQEGTQVGNMRKRSFPSLGQRQRKHKRSSQRRLYPFLINRPCPFPFHLFMVLVGLRSHNQSLLPKRISELSRPRVRYLKVFPRSNQIPTETSLFIDGYV